MHTMPSFREMPPEDEIGSGYGGEKALSVIYNEGGDNQYHYGGHDEEEELARLAD